MTPFTLVAFHAHPDDETPLTGGTIAKAAAAGHRVVLVVATLGEAGLTGEPGVEPHELGERRLEELRVAARVLGCAVEWLGYADSGLGQPVDAADTFAGADRDEAAARLAAVLREEQADALTIYDAAGGYGHPDHVQVHRVGRQAAALAGTRVVLEATVDRQPLLRLTHALRYVPRLPPEFRAERLATAYTHPSAITHAVDVRDQLPQKRAAMAAHASQTTGGDTPRSLAVFLGLPSPVFRWLFGREWFVEHGRVPGKVRLDDVFASLRAAGSEP